MLNHYFISRSHFGRLVTLPSLGSSSAFPQQTPRGVSVGDAGSFLVEPNQYFVSAFNGQTVEVNVTKLPSENNEQLSTGVLRIDRGASGNSVTGKGFTQGEKDQLLSDAAAIRSTFLMQA